MLYCEAFLTTYRTFITPEELIQKLQYRYPSHPHGTAGPELERAAGREAAPHPALGPQARLPLQASYPPAKGLREVCCAWDSEATVAGGRWQVVTG